MPDQKIATRPVAETITPLQPSGSSFKAKDSAAARRRYYLKILALALCLVLLVVFGAWLLHELAKKPLPVKTATLSRVPAKPTGESQAPPVVQQKVPAAAKPAPVKPDRPRPEQKPNGPIEAFNRLMALAGQHEQSGDLVGALANYQQAAKIDPDSGKARLAIKRVQHLLAEQKFQQLMSEGLAAIHAADYRTARRKLVQARKIKPASREAAEALFQVDQALRLERIENLGRRARAAEQAEDWPRALKAYLAVLEMDASIQFAIQGKARVLEQQRLFKGLDFFLANPKLLESDSQLRNAVLLLGEAETATVQGPKLKARIAGLQRLVKIAQTPVRVIIESDNQTRVAVYRVGKLGRFSVRELQLRPGTYTVVGARDGYQDVRRKIVVKPGQSAVRVSIACRVKI